MAVFSLLSSSKTSWAGTNHGYSTYAHPDRCWNGECLSSTSLNCCRHHTIAASYLRVKTESQWGNLDRRPTAKTPSVSVVGKACVRPYDLIYNITSCENCLVFLYIPLKWSSGYSRANSKVREQHEYTLLD